MKTKKHLAVLFLTISLFLCVGCQYDKVGTQIQETAPNNTLECLEFTLSVTLSPEDTKQYDIVGSLCSTGSFENKTVQVLVSGSTYGKVYWDFPYQPEHYSYVRAAVNAGYVTCNFDRIGIGESSHPPGDAVTVQSNAYVIHQIIQALLVGQIGDVPFKHVILMGHSLGSSIALYIAEQYPDDVNGVILTGFLHEGVMSKRALSLLYPADQDPRFNQLKLGANYNTSVPGKRTIFYHLPNADKAVIKVDEETKETITNGEIKTVPAIVLSKDSKVVKVPLIMMLGRFDNFFCNEEGGCVDPASYVKKEQSYYSPEACIKVSFVPDSGHDINLHRNSHVAFSRMLEWSDQHVGVDGANIGACSHK